MSGRILIVEDEPVLLRGLKDTFVTQGWEVETASDGEQGLELALAKPADVILLDIMLPRVNGYEICRTVRERGVESAILMLTAKGQEEDVVLGLNLGADDYLTKPFRRGELLARANALLRRAKGKGEAVARFGSYELHLAAHKLFRDGEEVELTAKEFRVLAFLATHPGRAMTREEILNAAWGNSVMVTPRSIDRCMATLRAKIEADPPPSAAHPYGSRLGVSVRVTSNDSDSGLAHRRRFSLVRPSGIRVGQRFPPAPRSQALRVHLLGDREIPGGQAALLHAARRRIATCPGLNAGIQRDRTVILSRFEKQAPPRAVGRGSGLA